MAREPEKGASPGPEKPVVRTRWLDGSKYMDPEELSRSEEFRKIVEAVRKIKPQHGTS